MLLYFHLNDLHRDDGPAKITVQEDGSTEEEYYLEGKRVY